MIVALVLCLFLLLTGMQPTQTLKFTSETKKFWFPVLLGGGGGPVVELRTVGSGLTYTLVCPGIAARFLFAGLFTQDTPFRVINL